MGQALVSGRTRPSAPAAWRRPRRLLLVLDGLAAALTLLLGLSFYKADTPWRLGLEGADARSTTAFLVVFVALAVIALAVLGSYSAVRRLSRIDDGLLLGKALMYAFVLALGIAFVSKGFGTGFTDYSRRVALTSFVVAFVLFLVARVLAWSWQRALFVRREGLRRVVVIGVGAAAAEFERFVAERAWLGTRCEGALRVLDGAPASDLVGGLVLSTPVVGALQDDAWLSVYGDVDELVVALDEDERRELSRVLRRLAALAIPFRIIPSLFEHTYREARDAGLIGGPAGVSTVSYRVEPLDRVQRALKRLLDTVVAGLVLCVLAPAFLILALLVRLTSPGPAFFGQARVGENGRVFTMHKFRTMYADAEARLAEVAHLNEGEDVLFKIRDDPRVTSVGRFLRRWSMDELPQFWNVLKGEMSVVGPRPPLLREVEAYHTEDLARLKGKPGITGLWQISGRSDLTFEQMVDLDRYYLESWSLGLDLGVMLRTVHAVVRRRGAY